MANENQTAPVDIFNTKFAVSSPKRSMYKPLHAQPHKLLAWTGKGMLVELFWF